jgi:hypothetical protein
MERSMASASEEGLQVSCPPEAEGEGLVDQRVGSELKRGQETRLGRIDHPKCLNG